MKKGYPLGLRTLQVLVVGGLLAIWEIAGRAGWVSPVFFPTPWAIFKLTVELFRTGELTAHLGATLSRMIGGFLLGGVIGVLIGLPMGWSAPIRRFLDPFVASVHAIPKISLLPLIMIVIGIGEAPKLVIIGLASFFPMVINSLAGVQQISPLYCEVARNYGAGSWGILRKVILPGSLPMIFAGIRLAFNSALVLTIAVELVTADTGLGALIWTAWETFRIGALYAAVFITALLGVLFNFVLGRIARWAIPWQPPA